jgi:anti-sigma factor ChrR (cupin superfamily)
VMTLSSPACDGTVESMLALAQQGAAVDRLSAPSEVRVSPPTIRVPSALVRVQPSTIQVSPSIVWVPPALVMV